MMYPVKIFYSEEDKGYIATIPDLLGCSAFGNTEEEALKEVKIAQQLWLKAAQSENRHIPRPTSEIGYGGKILLRTPKSLHQQLMEKAKEEGVSLNQFILYLLSQNVQATKKARADKASRSHS